MCEPEKMIFLWRRSRKWIWEIKAENRDLNGLEEAYLAGQPPTDRQRSF